jgi:hypothetical protein
LSASTSDSLCTSFSSAWMPLSSSLIQVVEGEHVVHDLLRQLVVASRTKSSTRSRPRCPAG